MPSLPACIGDVVMANMSDVAIRMEFVAYPYPLQAHSSYWVYGTFAPRAGLPSSFQAQQVGAEWAQKEVLEKNGKGRQNSSTQPCVTEVTTSG